MPRTNRTGIGKTGGRTTVTYRDAKGISRDAVVTASGAANEQQTVTQTGASAGTFTLTFDGQTTAGIAYNATAAAVDTALEALSNIGVGDVTCTGGPLGTAAVTVEFTGSLAQTNVTQMTADSAGLTGGTAVVATTVPGAPISTLTMRIPQGGGGSRSVTAIPKRANLTGTGVWS